MNKFEVVGFTVTKSKNDRIGTTLYLACEHDQYHRENALVCEGNATCEEYVPGDLSSKVNVGDLVTLVYGKGYQGKAVVIDVIPAGK